MKRLHTLCLGAMALILAAMPLAAAEAAPTASSPAETEVRDLLKTYFRTWSDQDMPGYGACFHPEAQIWFVGHPALPLPLFIESQKEAHQQSRVRMKEVPLSIDVTIRNGLAHAQVHWELRAGDRVERGYDFFTLANANGRWAILALAFNEEKP